MNDNLKKCDNLIEKTKSYESENFYESFMLKKKIKNCVRYRIGE